MVGVRERLTTRGNYLTKQPIGNQWGRGEGIPGRCVAERIPARVQHGPLSDLGTPHPAHVESCGTAELNAKEQEEPLNLHRMVR